MGFLAPLGLIGATAGAGAGAATAGITAGSVLTGLATSASLLGTGLGIANALNPPKIPTPPPPPSIAQPMTRGSSFLGADAGSMNGTFLGGGAQSTGGGGKTLLGQ